jgi:hypothetical protein
MFCDRSTYNPLNLASQDYDESQLRVKRISKNNDESEAQDYVIKARAYNANKESGESEEFRIAHKRMGYSNPAPTLHEPVEPERPGRKLFNPEENGNLKGHLSGVHCSPTEDEAQKAGKQMGYDAASAQGKEEVFSRNATRAHNAFHNAHNTGKNGFCYSNSATYHTPQKVPLFNGEGSPQTLEPHSQPTRMVARGQGNRHTQLW